MTLAMDALADTSDVEEEFELGLPRAAWTTTAQKIDPSEVTDDMVPFSEVCKLTGVSLKALRNTISHPIDYKNRRATFRPLAQPEFNVGGVPYWSRSRQLKSYFDIVDMLSSPDKTWAHLPRVSKENAVLAQLVSLSGMSKRGPRIPIATLHRWKGREHFPEPIARIDSGGPSPMLLYPWRSSEHLGDVLEDALFALFPEGRPDWWCAALRQMPVLDWMREHNPSWVETHPDHDLDVFVTEP